MLFLSSWRDHSTIWIYYLELPLYSVFVSIFLKFSIWISCNTYSRCSKNVVICQKIRQKSDEYSRISYIYFSVWNERTYFKGYRRKLVWKHFWKFIYKDFILQHHVGAYPVMIILSLKTWALTFICDGILSITYHFLRKVFHIA